MNVDISGWDKTNVVLSPSGDMVVREAFANVLSGLTVKHGFSIIVPRTDTVHYYFFHLATNFKCSVYDESFKLLSTFDYGTPYIPPVITHAVVEDEIVVCAPGLPMLWGLVGSGALRLAAAQDSVAELVTTSLNTLPSGICVGWAGRAVVCDGEQIFISDALYPQTYVGANTLVSPCGTVYGLHVNATGDLIICGDKGVFALPLDAAASDQIVSGVWSKLSDYQAINHQTTVVARGRVFGLTKVGYMVIDKEGGEEVNINNDTTLNHFEGQSAFDNYKGADFFADQNALYVAIGGRIHYTDLNTGFKSWWIDQAYGNLGLCGVVYSESGEEVYLLSTYGPCRFNGNYGGSGVEGYASNIVIQSFITGRVEFKPEESANLRDVSITSNTFGAFGIYFDGELRSVSPHLVAPTVGATAWTASSFPIEAKRQTSSTGWVNRGDDLSVQVYVSYSCYHISKDISLEFKGPSPKRPQR